MAGASGGVAEPIRDVDQQPAASCRLSTTAIIPLLVLIASLLGVALPAHAGDQQQPTLPGRDAEREHIILERLEAVNPAAVPVFVQATSALDADNLPAAKRGFEEVLRLAPGFADAQRRLSSVELRLGNEAVALDLARSARATDPSPENAGTLALALLFKTDVTEAEKQRALDLAHTAADALPDDAWAQTVLLHAALCNWNDTIVRRASADVVRLDPDHPLGHFAAGLVAAQDGRWELAESELRLAERLGYEPARVREVLDMGVARHAMTARLRRRVLAGVLWWALGGSVLFGLGVVLSRITMAAVRRYEATAETTTSRAETIVRSVYRVVIALASAYFYVSIPVLVLIVAALVFGVIWLSLSAGRVPIRFTLMVVVGGGYTLFAVIRSAFVRFRDVDPGRPVTREEASGLWSLSDSLAASLGTRPVDSVYVTPGTAIGVMERGGTLTRLRGLGRRCLIVGLGALPGMTQGQFRAILAHEYGHFVSRDTAGGDLARRVHVSVMRMAQGLAAAGQANWYNPGWLFVNAFHRVFLRVTHGASRLQEIVADRLAVATCGAQDFITGLLHIVRRDAEFDWQVNGEVQDAVAVQRKLSNLYALPPPGPDKGEAEVGRRVEEAINAPVSPYSTHPGVAQRIELARKMSPGSGGKVAPSTGTAWELFAAAPSLQEEMTAVVQANVDRYSAGGGAEVGG